jgi:NDP-sugar pyrophosphorylase family protein
MKALILAGGEGTRLRPLTIHTPKPIVPIGNQPFLLRQIELLKKAGIRDIILSLNYQPSAIEKVLGDGSDFGVRLRYLIEPIPLGTAGAYKFAEQFLNNTTVVLNGDILTDIDLQSVIKHHQNHQALATIVLTEVENPLAYGLVKVGNESEVINFLEKPKADEVNNLNTINAGIYIFEQKVLELIPTAEKYSFEYQLFPDLLKRKEKFYAYTATDNYWLDIGTPERYLQAHYALMDEKISNFQTERKQDFDVSDSAEIDKNSIIGKGCVIKEGAKVINSVLGENVIVEANATVFNSVIWAATKVGSSATILNSIIGNDCSIGKNVLLSKSSVLGDKTILSDFSTC